MELLGKKEDWTDERFAAPKDGFDRELFQQRLDKIVSFRRDKRIIRLVFGSEEEELKESQISGLGMGLGVKPVGRHTTKIHKERFGKVETQEVRIRRWIFEEWQPPEQTAGAGHVLMPGGGYFVPPETSKVAHEGDWVLLYIIADHTRCGCAKNDYSCMGAYREPDKSDLKKFEFITAQIQGSEIERDPFSPMADALISKLQQGENARLLREEDEKWRAVDERIDDRAATRKKHSVSGNGTEFKEQNG